MLLKILHRSSKFQTKFNLLHKPFNSDSLQVNLCKIKFHPLPIQLKSFERKEFKSKISHLTQLQN